MVDPLHVLRSSHERLRGLLEPLGPDEVTRSAYPEEWTIADVVSHLGSQAELFGAFLTAGLAGEDPPGFDTFAPVWDRWNATPPVDQVTNSLRANEEFVSRVEGLSPEERATRMQVFGREVDVDGLATIRISEHAVHTWDVAVALDPTATVAADAVELLAGSMPTYIGRGLKAFDGGGTVSVRTTDPDGTYLLDLSNGTLLDDGDADAQVTLPAEAFLRLVYGRLDPVDGEDEVVARLRAAFPGV